MILAVDVTYQKEVAIVGGVLFRNWKDEKPLKKFVVRIYFQPRYLNCISKMTSRQLIFSTKVAE